MVKPVNLVSKVESIIYNAYQDIIEELKHSLTEIKDAIPKLQEIVVEYDDTSTDCPYVTYIIDGEELDIADIGDDKIREMLDEFENALCSVFGVFGCVAETEDYMLKEPIPVRVVTPQ